MKLYRCDLCGRVFHKITPHVCVHGNYRKRNLTFTEFEDVDCEYIKKSEVDVKEKYLPNIQQRPLILEKALDPKIEFMVNWEQERVNIAKDTMRDILKQAWDDKGFKKELGDWSYKNDLLFLEYIANSSVMYADALIAELKKD